MKLLSTLITILILGLAISGQCSLPIEKAPKLGGAFLGMTVDQAIARYGRPFVRESDHVSFLDSFPVMDGGADLKVLKASNFDGISGLQLGLEGDKASNILIFYKSDVKWDSPREFATALSQKLGLPNAWTYSDDGARLECGAWYLTAEASTNRVFLADMTPIRKKVADERRGADDKKKAFKP